MLMVFSTLYGAHGGIPAFNRLLLRAAQTFCHARRLPLGVIALTDPAPRPADCADVDYLPCGGDRALLLRAVLRQLGRPLPLLLGHVNLAPIGLVWPRATCVIAHGSEVWSPLPPLRRLALQRADRVACVSDHTASRVHQVQGVPSARCQRVINALPVDQLPPPVLPPTPATDPASRAAPRPLRLLSVTRLHPDEPKGIDLVLRALSRLPPDFATYTVLGEGAAKPPLMQLAASLGLGPDRVRFLGAVPDRDRDAALQACDVFVLPSRGEGFGIVYLEAMAHAKPCVAARVGGVPEVVVDGQTGLTLPDPLSIDDLAMALHRLGDPDLRARLGAAGHARVQAHFTYPAFTRHAHALFAALTDPGACRAPVTWGGIAPPPVE